MDEFRQSVPIQKHRHIETAQAGFLVRGAFFTLNFSFHGIIKVSGLATEIRFLRHYFNFKLVNALRRIQIEKNGPKTLPLMNFIRVYPKVFIASSITKMVKMIH